MIKAGDERVKLAMLPKVKKSGGPTSKKGKKAISQNATKSGVYSRSIVLPNEDKAIYQQLVNRYMEEFKPTDMAETTMVTNLANLTWKKMRLDHFEQNSMIDEWNRFVTLSDLKSEKMIHFNRDVLWLELQVSIRSLLKLDLDGLVDYYEELKISINELYSQNVNTHYLERFFAKEPELLKAIFKTAKESFHKTNVQIGDLLNTKVMVENKSVVLLEACTNELVEKSEDATWYRDNEERINQAKLQLKERRLMEQMQKTDFSRAHDELDRSFYRTLSELRKQQQWRREQNEVVVIQESPKK